MDNELLNKLICLNCCKPSLKYKDEELTCANCGQSISLDDGIPNFLLNFKLGNISWETTNMSADAYESFFSQENNYRMERIDRPLLQNTKGDVLEIGCGTCRLARRVEEQGCRYFGLDPVFNFLLYAAKRYNLTRLVCGQGERLPFQDKSFDSIISGFYAYRYVKPSLGFPEARRVLKTGGKFTFDLLNYWALKAMGLINYFRGMKLKNNKSCKSEANSFEFVSLPELKQKAEKAGFLVESVISTPISPIKNFNKYLSNFYFRNKMLVYLGYDVIIVLRAI